MKSLIFALALCFLAACKQATVSYKCPPCKLPCDDKVYTTAGSCPNCGMTLQEENTVGQVSDEIRIETGSGSFWLKGGAGKENKPIRVWYHKPKRFTSQSKILFVVPGAGRNGDSYRNSWIDKSEQHGFLVLALTYPEWDYPFEDYHLCGLVSALQLQQAIEPLENTNQIFLNEQKVRFELNSNQEQWLFNDFDRLFEKVVATTGSEQKQYDIFGHSAGGQILHRFVLFGKSEKARKIIACNSGFYTTPNLSVAFPFGLKNTPLDLSDVQQAFQKELYVLVGEHDDMQETRGTLLRSETVDRQGLHRLARARSFYKEAETMAEREKWEIQWKLIVVPAVGHDHRKMGDTAVKLLYMTSKR